MNCQKTTQLLSQAQERKLLLGEKVSLQMHLVLCSACKNFSRQVQFLRQAARTYAKQKD